MTVDAFNKKKTLYTIIGVILFLGTEFVTGIFLIINFVSFFATNIKPVEVFGSWMTASIVCLGSNILFMVLTLILLICLLVFLRNKQNNMTNQLENAIQKARMVVGLNIIVFILMIGFNFYIWSLL